MYTFNSELTHSYKNYSFGYCNYAVREKGDKLSNIYKKGYLPYSGRKNVKDVFYMARSARINLGQFTLNSENRRIAKRFDGSFSRERIPFKKYNYNDNDFLSFCLKYFTERHGPKVMPRERLLAVLESGLISHIILYKTKNKKTAYVFEVSDIAMAHFWFSFYDLELVYKSLGMWLMIDTAREAHKQGKQHLYVGTVYGEKALYKTNFSALEYWDGGKWIADKKKLRARSRKDIEREITCIDEWKEYLN